MHKASHQRFDIVKSLQKLNIPDKQVAKAVGLSKKTIKNYKMFDTYEEYSANGKRWKARQEAKKADPIGDMETVTMPTSPRTQAIVALATAISQLVDVLIEEKT